MALVLRKYGGSSVATVEKIQFVAKQIKSLYAEGNNIVCVVSAMGTTTDRLVEKAREISPNPNPRELDMLLSIGERQSISLMALALAALDVPTVSFTGSQVGIITNNNHGNAQILEVKTDRIRAALDAGKVVVVAGYQGVSTEKEITTLGRGGTDTTAVALAAALHADRCELMKDVDGLYQVPPKILAHCNLRAEVSHADMIAIAEAGAELVAAPALELAQKEGIALGIGNTQKNYVGTIVVENPLQAAPTPQLIVADCHVGNEHAASDSPYVNTFYMQNRQLSYNLDPDFPEKNSVLVTLLNGARGTEEELSKLKPLFFSRTKNAAAWLFPIQQKETVEERLSTLARNL